jgi:hypothetical protein
MGDTPLEWITRLVVASKHPSPGPNLWPGQVQPRGHSACKTSGLDNSLILRDVKSAAHTQVVGLEWQAGGSVSPIWWFSATTGK